MDPKEKTEVVELNEAELVKQVADTVKEGLGDSITEAVNEATKGISDSIAELKKASDEEVKKDVDADLEKDGEEDVIKKGIEAGEFSEEIVKESKEMRLFKAARALHSGDAFAMRSYQKLTNALREKAGYANETTSTDGAVLVPDPEFDTEVYQNLPKYGVAFQYADVRETTRTAVYALSLDSGLTFYPTAEAGVKTGGKLDFSRKQVALQKYAVIVPSTDELTDDAAVDYWNLVTQELTRAYARVADEVVFNNSTNGVTNATGIITHPVSGAGTTITWDDLLAAEAKTEDDQEGDYKWFMRKETWYRLNRLRADAVSAADGKGMYLSFPNPNDATTPWGTPVVFTRVLPKSTEVGSNDAFAVYGDLRNVKLYNKKGMEITMLREATIKDSTGTDFNLATQDGTAMRAVIRLLAILPKGNASKFVVVGTGTVS